ncbi:MAG: membrane protein insertase YidC [Flavobacteriaceae bacterium]|nr:membrane protein insertase YidC [Flavobacteriaceae bacterium]
MEDKKFDLNQLIGYILIAGLITFMFYNNKGDEENPENADENTKTEQTAQTDSTSTSTNTNTKEVTAEDFKANGKDSLAVVALQSKLGYFAASGLNASDQTTTVETDLLKLEFSNKGGYLKTAELKKFKTFDKKPLYLVKDNNADFNLNFGTTDSRILNTKDLYFSPTLTQKDGSQVLSMKLKVSDTKFLEYRYEIKKEDYMIDFAIRSQGLSDVINSNNPIKLEWDLKTIRNEKSISYEHQNSYLHYNAGEVDCFTYTSDDDDVIDSVTWVGYKQHFFSSILLTDKPFAKADMKQKMLTEARVSESDSPYLKQYNLDTNLALQNGEINENMQWYYGPNDYQILNGYDKDLTEIINLGDFFLFKYLNKWLFIPIFDFLSSFIGSYGLIIILMTIVVRLLMSPLVYKSYLSSAKMKVIRPEMQAINEKYPDKKDAMKRQQEVMALQKKTGVSMMSGCIPALMQMPIFFALFRFFPSEIGLRQKGFLWAEDLSAYDEVFKLPFEIPFYGNHVSLFPILASIAIFFYMRMSQSQQANMSMPTQEGMPDMQKMMKYMLYISPIMMLFFFNQYASGLSLYYFISNLLTIGIMFAIKKFLIDEKKILAQIEENKKKPVKENKFQKRMREMMAEAEKQQRGKGKK